MPYTVWSRGRLIGETDLGFVRVVDESRSGWFHPNAEGERVMPVIAAPLPAMRAYLHRNAVDASGQGLVRPDLDRSTLFADLAESFQHLQALELELRRHDGSVVPTADIGIQDTHRLLALAEESLQGDDELPELAEPDPQLEADIEHDTELFLAAFEGSGNELSTPWTPEDLEEPRHPRYQIHVLLLQPDAIP